MPPLSERRSRQAPETEIEREEWINAVTTAQAKRAAEARHASRRRKLVDPTTCERDYADAEIEFMNAMQAYKSQSGRMFPTWSEILEVLRGLGYAKSSRTPMDAAAAS
jgi:hypothetical protein